MFRTKQSKGNDFFNKEPESLYTHYAAAKDWEAYWQGHAYWPYKESERPCFSARASFLYERYLSVRKAVSSELRVDSTLKLSNKRPSLLHVDEEIQLIKSLGNSSGQLKARKEHLVKALIDHEIPSGQVVRFIVIYNQLEKVLNSMKSLSSKTIKNYS